MHNHPDTPWILFLAFVVGCITALIATAMYLYAPPCECVGPGGEQRVNVIEGNK